jgi:hypothetical protein
MGAGTDLSVMLPEKGISGINGGIPRILQKQQKNSEVFQRNEILNTDQFPDQ